MNRYLKYTLLILFNLTVFLLLLNLGMNKPIDHDEHQFIASAAMLQRLGWLPYVDFAYFHQPYLVYIYAALFHLSDKLLFITRFFSIICATVTLTIIFRQAYNLQHDRPFTERYLIAAGSVILLLVTPVFHHTAGLAWNHDLPMLLAFLAFLLQAATVKGAQPSLQKTFLSGLLLGIATGVRLSFAPLFAPFFLLPFIFREHFSRRQLIHLALFFSGGFLLAMLPSLYFLATHTDAYLFGNLGYPGLNTLFRESQGYTRSMDMFSKLIYTVEMVLQPGNLILITGAFIFALKRPLISNAYKDRRRPEIAFVLLMMPFLLMGTFAATPSFKQYFYPPFFYLLIAIIYAVGSFPELQKQLNKRLQHFALFLLIVIIYTLPRYSDPFQLPKVKYWHASQVHQMGEEVRELIGEDGRVFTFAPIIPLEGGLEIYPELITGPFAWRTGQFLDADERLRHRIAFPDQLETFLAKKPPSAILQGYEWRLEPPLIDYAKRNNYSYKTLRLQKRLWLPPVP